MDKSMSMLRTVRYYKHMWLKYNLKAGISVFFVALPLCLGIAVASNAPVQAGIMAGIIGGLVVPIISKSALSVSGPAAGLSTLVAAMILAGADFSVFLLQVLVAGAFQLLIGALRMGNVAHYFPSAVIKGMLAAIGIILMSKQIPLALGYDKPDFWTSGFLDLFASWNVGGQLAEFWGELSPSAIVIAGIGLFMLIYREALGLKKGGLLPISFWVVSFGIVVQMGLSYWLPNHALENHQRVQIPDTLFETLHLPDWTLLFSQAWIWKNGLVLGMLASLETLLCIEAIDKLDKRNRITPLNRELMAQGVGNMVCGLLGAIPITAVVVRGAANVEAGAHTKLSAITHGFLILLSVLLIPVVLNQIPYASLAAILIMTGYKLTPPSLYIKVWKSGLQQFLPFILTIFIILLTDLLIGVSIGLLLSIYFIIQNNFKADFKVLRKQNRFIVKLGNSVTFLNKVKLKKILDDIPALSEVEIDASESEFIDYDILEIIESYRSKAKDRNIRLHLIGLAETEQSIKEKIAPG